MSRISDLINKEIENYKNGKNFIDDCDIVIETEYFFEKYILPRLIDDKNHTLIQTSKIFMDIFKSFVSDKYNKEYDIKDKNKVFDSIFYELSKYEKEEPRLKVRRNELPVMVLGDTIKIFISLDI